MDNWKTSSSGYEFCFPDVKKEKHNDYEYVFSNYGCMEAVNLEYDDARKKILFTAKNQKPLIADEDATNVNWIHVPSHPAIPLGNPETIPKLPYIPIKNDLLFKRFVHSQSKETYDNIACVEEHISNFTLDHPDAAQGTFLDLLAQYFRYPNNKEAFLVEPYMEVAADCGFIVPKYLFKCGRLFPKNVDPYMFDIPYSVLNKLLLEEFQLETKHLLYDSSYTGGTLSYKHIDHRKDLTYGLLFRPGGKDMSELNIQLLCTDSSKEFEGDETKEFFPKLHLGSEHRSSLNGRILQINTQPFRDEPTNVVVGTRTMHHALVSMVDGKQSRLEIDEEGNFISLQFSSPDCVKHCGVLQSSQVVNSMSLSPYIPGECVVAMDDGKLYLWNASHRSSVVLKQESVARDLQPVFTDDVQHVRDKWSQVEFASHPRQVILANRKQIRLVDLRGKTSSMQNLVSTNGKEDNSIMTILSGTNFSYPHEFQYLVATPSEINLHDIRYHKMSLLNWSLNMRTPCQHLAVIGAPLDGATFNMDSILLAASQKSQEIHMHQYNLKSKTSDSFFHPNMRQQSWHPPVATAPPYGCETFKDFRRTLTRRLFRSHGYLDNRLSYPITGVTGYEYKTHMGESKIISLQVSGCGDLMYQPFELAHPKEAWNDEYVTSGTLPNHSKVVKDKQKRLVEKADEVRLDWASSVCSRYGAAVEEESSFNLRSARTTLNAMRFSQAELFGVVTDLAEKNRESDCVCCGSADHASAGSRLTESDSDITSGDSSVLLQKNAPADPESDDFICRACGIDKRFSRLLVESHKKKVSHLATAQEDCDVDWPNSQSQSVARSKPEVEDLKLVELAPTKAALGGVLCDTWDSSYEEFWKSLRTSLEEEGKIQRKKDIEDRLDVAAKEGDPDTTIPDPSDHPLHNNLLEADESQNLFFDSLKDLTNASDVNIPIERSKSELTAASSGTTTPAKRKTDELWAGTSKRVKRLPMELPPASPYPDRLDTSASFINDTKEEIELSAPQPSILGPVAPDNDLQETSLPSRDIMTSSSSQKKPARSKSVKRHKRSVLGFY